MGVAPILLQWLDNQRDTLSTHPYAALTLVIIFSTFVLSKLLNNNGGSSDYKKLLPSPPSLPLIGNFHQLGVQMHRSLGALAEKYGPLMLVRFGRIPIVVISSVEMAREIKKTNDIAFASRPFSTGSENLFYKRGNMAFAPYGEYWRQMRRVCVLELLSIKSVMSFKSVREEEVAFMLKNISSSCLKRTPLNMAETLLSLTNNIVCRCALGRRSEGEAYSTSFGELSRRLLKLLGVFTFADFFPGFGWMDHVSGVLRQMKKASTELDNFLDQVVQEHIVRNKDHDGPDYREDFVDILLRSQKDSSLGFKFTRDNLKAVIMDMFLGGTDTASTTMEWALAELIKNPDVMKKVQEEVRRVVGKKSKVGEEELVHMDYLKSVIKETLRLHAPAPLVPYESFESTSINGIHFPVKTRVMVNIWAIQMDPKVWENPEKFIPERFENSPVDFRGQHFELIPFGSGRRSCPGMSFAVAVVELGLANLLYWFDWEFRGGAKEPEIDMTEMFGITVNKRIPLQLLAKTPSLDLVPAASEF